MRIRRTRIRRTAAAGAAVIVAVAGVLSVTAVLHQHSSGPAITGGQQFPASFTASDGTSYRRVAVTSLTLPAQKSVTIKLKVGTEPVDVMDACGGGQDPGAAEALVAVNGTDSGGFICPGTPQLIGLPVRLNREADITFTEITIPGIRKVGATTWRFAVYEWKPPAVARPAPPIPQLPETYIGNNTTTGHGKVQLRKIASRSGDWPGDRTATFTVHLQDRNLDISTVCSGAIAGRLIITMQVDGLPASASRLQCVPWAAGKQPPGNTAFAGQAGRSATLTFRIEAPSPALASAYAKRAASWTIAIYQEGP